MCQRCWGDDAHSVGTVTVRDINGTVVDESQLCLGCMTPVAKLAELSLVPLLAGLDMIERALIEGRTM